MTLQDIVDRCEKFSGYRLNARIEERSYGRVLIIEAVGEAAREHPYSLVLTLLRPDMSVLKELNGRLRHWGVSLEEQRVIAAHLMGKQAVPAMDPFAVVDF